MIRLSTGLLQFKNDANKLQFSLFKIKATENSLIITRKYFFNFFMNRKLLECR